MSSTLPKKSYARIPVNINLPNLIEVQLDSFERLKREGLGDLFQLFGRAAAGELGGLHINWP